MVERIRRYLIYILAVALSLYTVYEANYGMFPPLSQLAVFCLLGVLLCFLMYPLSKRLEKNTSLRIFDFALCVLAVICCGYLVWEGEALIKRQGQFLQRDFLIAILGTALIVEATRRSIGLALPILSGLFLLYAYYGAKLPEWAFFHKGYSIDRIAAKCFLGSQGVFGTAMRVMFTYVFLFVVFGAFLEMSGATKFIISFAQRVFGRSPGGPAKVSVLASGLMGSLSGSAVANAVTTGTFTIPMMRNAGFQPHVSGGITAAAASGGALVPPVMGAGAYMMLELIDDVTFVQIMRAAIVPAILYYLSILLIVHFFSNRIGSQAAVTQQENEGSPLQYEGIVFFGALGSLITVLLIGKTPFAAVSYSMELILVLTILSPKLDITKRNRLTAFITFLGLAGLVSLFRIRSAEVAGLMSAGWWQSVVEFLEKLFRADSSLSLSDWTVWTDSAIPGMVLLLLLALLHPVWKPMVSEAFMKSARGGVSLVSASGCVGIVIGVVSLTGVGTAFPNAIVPLAEQSLFLALVAIMTCSIILGMGLPSAVCYLLMATLIGPVLNRLGVPPLAAHLFIFYFGMMSMVTPPVALAAYASASIADAPIMRTGLAAFRFSLVGFTLPFMFIYRPELLLMSTAPDVKAIKTDAKLANTPAKVTGSMVSHGKPLADSKLIFRSESDSQKSTTVTTGSGGEFTVNLSPGRWILSVGESLDKSTHLGIVDLDPTRESIQDESGKPIDQRVLFEDERLSLLAVILAIAFAVMGIVALAAGIAGFLFTEINPLIRAVMCVAAALLLSPDITIGGQELGMVFNIIGTLIFALAAAVNFLRSRRKASLAS